MRHWFILPFLLTSFATASDPRASLTGPDTSPIHVPIRLDPSGSVSAKPLKVKLLKGPAVVEPQPLFKKDGTLWIYEVVPSRPGLYEFYAAASGGADPNDPDFDFAFWSVTVPAVAVPPPAPAPAPAHVPPPVDTPPPSTDRAPPPPLVNGPEDTLFAVLVYNANPNDPGRRAVAPVLAEPTLAAVLDTSLDVKWNAWDYTNGLVDNYKLRPYLPPGFQPVILVYDRSGQLYNASGHPAGVATAAIQSPTTPDGVVALFKRIRGPLYKRNRGQQ